MVEGYDMKMNEIIEPIRYLMGITGGYKGRLEKLYPLNIDKYRKRISGESELISEEEYYEMVSNSKRITEGITERITDDKIIQKKFK